MLQPFQVRAVPMRTKDAEAEEIQIEPLEAESAATDQQRRAEGDFLHHPEPPEPSPREKLDQRCPVLQALRRGPILPVELWIIVNVVLARR